MSSNQQYATHLPYSWDEPCRMISCESLTASSNVYIEKDKGPLRLCCKHLIRPATYSWVYVERWDISYLCIDAVHCAKCKLLCLVWISLNALRLNVVVPVASSGRHGTWLTRAASFSQIWKVQFVALLLTDKKSSFPLKQFQCRASQCDQMLELKISPN